MSDSELKVNSLRLRFERGSREPSDTEIFQFMRVKMCLKWGNLLSMYKETRDLSVIIKFASEKDFKTTLKNLPGTMSFDYDKYESTTVTLSPANAVVKYVRLFHLPPEVTDREIQDGMCQYGKIQSTVREKYAEDTGFPIWTSVRGVFMELKEGAEIPATVQIRGLRARVYYEGLVNKCFICNSVDHLKAECPKRKTVNTRLEANQGASYSGAVKASWVQKKNTGSTEKPQSSGTMTNLNDLFPGKPKEKRNGTSKEVAMDTGSEEQPAVGILSSPGSLKVNELPMDQDQSGIDESSVQPVTIAHESTAGQGSGQPKSDLPPEENEWQKVLSKKQRLQKTEEGKKPEPNTVDDRKKPEEPRGPFRRQTTRVPRTQSLSKMQDSRSRSRLGDREKRSAQLKPMDDDANTTSLPPSDKEDETPIGDDQL